MMRDDIELTIIHNGRVLSWYNPPSSRFKKKMTDNKPSKKLSAAPVIYVHATGRKRTSETEVKTLLELDLPLCSRLKFKGITQTTHGYDQAGLLVAELSEKFPGRPIIFLRAGLYPSKHLLNQLTGLFENADQALALSLLSNADVAVNPFSGLQASRQINLADLSDLVALLAPGQLHSLSAWTDHFTMLSAGLVTQLAAETSADTLSGDTLMQRLQAIGGALKVPDHLFLPDPDSKVFTKAKLEPHESTYPPVFSELSARLQDWFDAGIKRLPLNPDNKKAATLHITHSWGGGVAQWLKSFIETDNNQRHLQLRSEGPQSGHGYEEHNEHDCNT